jgi:hypothetical protein
MGTSKVRQLAQLRQHLRKSTRDATAVLKLDRSVIIIRGGILPMPRSRTARQTTGI